MYMEDRGLERASRAADALQSVVFVIVLVIISGAVYLASFFIIQLFVPDIVFNSLLASAVSWGIAGLFAIWRGRIRGGSSFLFLSSVIAGATFSLYGNALHTTLFSIHAILIITTLILYNLYRKEVLSLELWTRIRIVFLVTIVLSGPISIVTTVLSYFPSLELVAVVFPGSMFVYTILLHSRLRNAKIGVLNVALVASTLGALSYYLLYSIVPLAEPTLIASTILIGSGIGLLFASQAALRLQIWIEHRTAMRTEKLIIEDEALEILGLDEEREALASQPEGLRVEWVIDSDTANALSGFALIFVAIAIPQFFLWLAGLTEWGVFPDFLFLMSPIAILFSLLLAAPAPVFFRLGAKIRRDTEYKCVRVIGVIIIIDTMSISFIWTQFFLWPLLNSIAIAALLFLTGITGLFRRIRQLWRQLWLNIIGTLRAVKQWVLANTLIAGIIADLLVCASIVIILLPLLSIHPLPILSLPSVFLVLFSGLGLLGIGALRNLPNRNRLLVFGIIAFLGSLFLVTFWYTYTVLLLDVITSVCVSTLWLLGTASLQKLGIRRRIYSAIYAVPVFAASYLSLTNEIAFMPFVVPVITPIAVLVLLAPIAHPEYRIAGTKLVQGVRYLGSILLKFIIYSAAVLIIAGDVLLAYYFIGPTWQIDPVTLLLWMVLIFFLTYSPVISSRDESSPRLRRVCVAGLALSIGSLVFLYSGFLFIVLRLIVSVSSSLVLLTLLRSQIPEKLHQLLYQTTWLSLLVSGLGIYYFQMATAYEPLPSVLTSLLVFSIGLLPLKRLGSSSKYVHALYLLLAIPSGVFLTHWFFADYLLSLVILILIPTPVAYRQYLSVLRRLGTALLLGVKVTIAYVAIYLVIFIGISGFAIAASLVYLMVPLFAFHSIPIIPQSLSLFALFLAIWLPALHLRRDENPRLHSVGILVFCAILACDIVSLVQFPDPVHSLLILTGLFGLLLFVSHRVITLFKVRPASIVLSLFSFLLLGLYIVPGDIVSKGMLAGLGLAFLTGPLVRTELVPRLNYPLGVLCGFGFVSWNLYLNTNEIVFSSAIFLAASCLFLSAPETKFRVFTWSVFSFSSGVLLYDRLHFLGLASIPLAVIVGLELLRLTPSRELKPRLITAFDLIRSILLASVVFIYALQGQGLFSILIHPIFGLDLTALTLFAVLYVSLRRHMSETVLTALAVVSIGLIGLFFYSYCSLILLYDFWFSLYLGLIPVVTGFLFGSTRGAYQRLYWFLFSSALIFICGSLWYAIYGTAESLVMSIPTVLFLYTSLRMRFLSEDANRIRQDIYVLSSLVLLLQTVFHWHNIIFWLLPPSVVLIATGVILGLTLALPLVHGETWISYEPVWDVISVILGLGYGSGISGWDITTLTLPQNPILTLGASLVCFSLAETSVTFMMERRLQITEDERVAHLDWLPGMIGWSLLGYYLGFLVWTELLMAVALAGLGFGVSGLVYYALMPDRSGTVLTVDFTVLSFSVASVVWIQGGPFLDLQTLLTVSILAGYITSLPITLYASIRFFTWLGGLIHRFFSWMYRGLVRAATWTKMMVHRARVWIGLWYSRNKLSIAFVLPVLLSGVIAYLSYGRFSEPILGLPLRPLLTAVTIVLLLTGLLYYISSRMMTPSLAGRLKAPSLLLIGFGLNNFLLSILLQSVYTEILELVFLVAAILTFTLFSEIVLVWYQGGQYRSYVTPIHKAIGPAIGLTFILGAHLSAIPLLQSVLFALALVTIIEIRYLAKYFVRLLYYIRNFGSLFIKGLRALVAIINEFFDKFGYYMWAVFSFIFVIILKLVTGNLFSELLNMPEVGFLYPVPQYSVPLLILGLLMFFISIVRRNVKSRYGLIGAFLALAGFAATATVGLFEIGEHYLSFFVGMTGLLMAGLVVRTEVELSQKWLMVLWIPIPICFSAIMFIYLLWIVFTIDEFIMAFLLAAFPTPVLWLVSTVFRWLPKRIRPHLWTSIAIMAGLIGYQSSYLAFFTPVASIYLSVLMASMLMWPVTGRRAQQLFYAPVFFSVTGFAFTFIFGPLIQSLLLALAAMLFFVSRYIKEKEVERPKLVYARLVVLLCVVAAITLFVALALMFAG
jgi:hypothetical protein